MTTDNNMVLVPRELPDSALNLLWLELGDHPTKQSAKEAWDAVLNEVAAAPQQPAPQAQAEVYTVDAVAWERFISDYDRYAAGDPKVPFNSIREGLGAVIDSARPQPQPTPEHPADMVLVPREPDYLGNVIKAAEKADWVQVVMNGGPPCFRLEGDGKFCLRAERWHEHPGTHGYVPLRAMLEDYKEALLQGVKKQIAQADEAFARLKGLK